jgi:hypothetical protein
MFVITADQVGSRTDIDRSTEMQRELQQRFGTRLRLPVDQTAGDELQVLTDHAGTALEIALALGRDGHWSVGLGVGDVRTPLPDAVRKATGGAFIAAREAVDAAKRADGRFALRAASGPTDTSRSAAPLDATELEPLIRLLVLVQDRRSPQGWEAIDLVREVGSQKRAAETLGISDAAVSQRLKAAVWSIDDEARRGLVRLLSELDRATASALGADGAGAPDGTAGPGASDDTTPTRDPERRDDDGGDR